MCTRLPMKIKGVSTYGQKFAYVPCGECEECRANQRNEWFVRLRCELDSLVKRGWWFGFITLTFDDAHLPRFPRALLRPECQESYDEMPQCFDRNLARDFIVRFRQWLFREYDCVTRKEVVDGVVSVVKDDSCRYLLCSEYGEHTHRCHHHFLLALPSRVPSRAVFDWIHANWQQGFCFPKDIDGGLDRWGYVHSPFVVDNVSSCCNYVSKYVCKDLSFAESFRRADFRDEYDVGGLLSAPFFRLRDYLPFHLQSRSLGASFVRNLTDSEMLRAVNVGLDFVGCDKTQCLPRYLRNKILFNTYYPTDPDGKRLVRYEPTLFFRENYAKIFDSKVDVLSKKIQDLRTVVAPHLASLCPGVDCFARRISTMSVRDVARDFLAYGGVDWFACYDQPRELQWFSRYDFVDYGDKIVELDFSRQYPLISRRYWQELNLYVNSLYFVQNYLDEPLEGKRRALRRQQDFYHDLYTSQE